MNKTLIASVIGLISILLVSGCSFDGVIEKFVPQAKGIILYGDVDTVNQDIADHSESLESSDSYTIKVDQNDKNKIMIMDEKTAEDLVDSGLLRKVSEKSGDNDQTEAIDSLPKVTKERPILFASKELDNVEIGEKQYDVSYEGNVIIGNGRSYVDVFMVVDDSTWDIIDGAKKTIGVLHFDDEHNPKKKMMDFKAEQVQLISIDD